MTNQYNRKGEWLEWILPGTARDTGGTESADGTERPCTPEEALERFAAIHPVPRRLGAQWLKEGGVLVKGRRLLIRMFPEEPPGVEPEWHDLEILYEDDFCLVVHKPAGMPVHPHSEGQKGTLAHAVASHFEQTGQRCRIRHIHRLDADTTGPVLYAKNEYAHQLLDEAMRNKLIRRTYLAVVEGVIRAPQGRIDAPIGRDRHVTGKMRVSPTGKPARTRFEVVGRAQDHTLIRAELETGRTHQIRVHFSHLGHPLAGDRLYGGSTRLIGRQALHGERLVFVHPFTKEQVTVTDPLPPELASLLETLGL